MLRLFVVSPEINWGCTCEILIGNLRRGVYVLACIDEDAQYTHSPKKPLFINRGS